MRLTTQVVNQMNSHMIEHGKTNDFDLIIGVTDGGNLLYGKDQYDITAEVLNNMNSTYAGE